MHLPNRWWWLLWRAAVWRERQADYWRLEIRDNHYNPPSLRHWINWKALARKNLFTDGIQGLLCVLFTWSTCCVHCVRSYVRFRLNSREKVMVWHGMAWFVTNHHGWLSRRSVVGRGEFYTRCRLLLFLWCALTFTFYLVDPSTMRYENHRMQTKFKLIVSLSRNSGWIEEGVDYDNAL